MMQTKKHKQKLDAEESVILTAFESGKLRSITSPDISILNGSISGSLTRLERFELPTPWFEARYSIQLSYRRIRNE